MEAAETPSTLCNECGINPSKYRCPGCSLRSCSLPCVKSHKTRTSCTGKRPRTQFVPLSQFDDNLLISDYSLLEETKRVADSSRRKRDDGLYGKFRFNVPFKLKSLKNAASKRKVRLLFMPSGMEKRDKNQTLYNHRKNFISWTIEWRFHSTPVVLVDNRVDENMCLWSVIEKHQQPGPWSNQLRPFFEQIDSLRFFIRKDAMGTKSPFCELDMKAPIGQQLANTVIVEYPVIHVFLPSATFDFEIVKNTEPPPHDFELKEPENASPSSPRGVLFREEEVEDDTSDPHILDLMMYMNPELSENDQLASSIGTLPMEYTGGHGVSNSEEHGFTANNDFSFEQTLNDVFADFIDEANPDEFLDYEGFYEEGIVVDAELEEGEIPASL